MTSSEPKAALDALVDPSAEIVQLGEGYGFSEGPTWYHPRRELLFSDVPGDTRWRWTEGDGIEKVAYPTFKGNGQVFEADGSLLVCEHVTSCVIRIRGDGLREVVAFHYEGKYLNSPNDVVVRSDGMVYFTDPNSGRLDTPHGVGRKCELDFQGVYCVKSDGSDLDLVVAREEFQQPNGLCFSPDESVLYINDTPAANIKAFDVAADGSLSNRRLFFSGIGDGKGYSGIVDGMKCDELGNVWCTGPGGVWVISPAGEQIGIVEVPESVGNLVWGGDDLRLLLLTASTRLFGIRTLVAAAPLPSHGGTKSPRSGKGKR